MHQQMLQGGHPWRASEMNATVRHAPHCYGDGTGGSSCADTYMDLPHDHGGMKQSDVEVSSSQKSEVWWRVLASLAYGFTVQIMLGR
jgi:hypothetical protein